MVRILGNEIRPGNVIEHRESLWVAVKVDHVKPGKGGAFAQVELRNVRNNSKLYERFRSADRVERVRLDQRQHQLLYTDGSIGVFMDAESFEQIELDTAMLGEQVAFLQDGMEVTIEFYGEDPLSISIPQKVTCVVDYAEPVVAGQTSANSFKPATLDIGIRVMVPPFVNSGDKIVVNTETIEYAERA